MSYYPYNIENMKLWMTGKESAFRTNASGKDTWKADAVVFTLPIRPERIVYYKKNKIGVYYLVNSGPDPFLLAKEGFEDGKMSISGPLIDGKYLHFLTKACTTTDDKVPASDNENPPTTVAAGKYTHIYKSTTARPATVPSFQMVQKLENDTATEGIWLLYIGCVIKHVNLKAGVENNIWTGTIDIEFARVIYTTTDLSSTQTVDSGLAPYLFEATSITFNKGGTSYQARMKAVELDYDDGTILDKANNEVYPERAWNGHRKVTCKLQFLPMEKQLLYDYFLEELAPTAASDVDVAVKLARNTTNDYQLWWFEKCYHIEKGTLDFAFNNYMLITDTTLIAKPTSHEADAFFQLNVVDAINDDPYET